MMLLTNVTLLITNCVRPGLCNVYWIPIHTRIKPEEACCSSDAQESPSYSEVQFLRASPDVSFFKHSELLVRSYFMTPKKKKKKKLNLNKVILEIYFFLKHISWMNRTHQFCRHKHVGGRRINWRHTIFSGFYIFLQLLVVWKWWRVVWAPS